ncbi:FAD/NAD(P)-binding protein [Undibacterium sp. TJN25]|uniref:FAD/NAD(P)-binding protein n=1 Tax=Undibacterium sp. TJN25 TaxID=3413056 RepID=UPI003BF43061
MQNIIIIGAGFSGTLTAVQLIRNSSGQSINVTLVDRNCDMGRGVAYKSDSKNYFLNVPAGNMSALEEDPNHFIEYCKKYNKKIVPSSFVSRAIYGDYLEQLLSDNERSLDGQVVITRVFGEVISLSAGNGTTPPSVTFKDGKKLTGNSIVLATGNYPPQNIQIFDRTFYLNEKYANDPWQLKTTTIFDRTVPTLLIGSGLTAIDICTSLLHKPGNEKIYLVSRHGLLPQSHRVSLPTYKTDQFTKPILDGLKTLRAQLRATRRQIHIASSGGADWREIINSI